MVQTQPTITLTRSTGRPQGRRPRAAKTNAGLTPPVFQTVSFSIPSPLIDLLKTAAAKRGDMNKSAVVSEALAEFFGVEVSGGEAKQAA